MLATPPFFIWYMVNLKNPSTSFAFADIITGKCLRNITTDRFWKIYFFNMINSESKIKLRENHWNSYEAIFLQERTDFYDYKIDQTTAKNWLHVLEALGIIFLLEPYSNNVLKRTVSTPKLYFCLLYTSSTWHGWQKSVRPLIIGIEPYFASASTSDCSKVLIIMPSI